MLGSQFMDPMRPVDPAQQRLATSMVRGRPHQGLAAPAMGPSPILPARGFTPPMPQGPGSMGPPMQPPPPVLPPRPMIPQAPTMAPPPGMPPLPGQQVQPPGQAIMRPPMGPAPNPDRMRL